MRERFVRGDESRRARGTALPADCIKLFGQYGRRMELAADDGDSFKVILRFPSEISVIGNSHKT